MRIPVVDLVAEAETLPEEWALVLFDRALAQRRCTSQELIAATRQSSERLQWLAVIADPRVASTAESLLRRAWYRGDLPTPSIGHRLRTPAGPLALVCATGYHRFAVCLEATPDQVSWVRQRGWRVLVFSDAKVRDSSSVDLAAYIRAEHLHHLATVGVDRHETRRIA